MIRSHAIGLVVNAKFKLLVLYAPIITYYPVRMRKG